MRWQLKLGNLIHRKLLSSPASEVVCSRLEELPFQPSRVSELHNLRDTNGETEEHVRDLHRTFREIGNTHKRIALTGTGIALGVIVGAKFGQVLEALKWAVGSAAPELLKMFRKPGELKARVEADPFFFAVKLVQEGELARGR